MSRNGIKSALKRKHNDWLMSIKNVSVRALAKENSYITGGAILSLMINEDPNDYDVYFTNLETTEAVARYYVNEWNREHKKSIGVKVDEDDRVTVHVASAGIASEDEPESEYESLFNIEGLQPDKSDEPEAYRPRFLTSNAITLADDVQLVIRFYGEPQEVHKSFDFVHTMCSYKPSTDELSLPYKSLEAILFKRLEYVGSRFPIASIIRTKKFVKRGWSCSAGQYLKMVLQIQDFDLTDPKVLEDQLTGMDSYYFTSVIAMINRKIEDEPNFKIDATYLVEVINKVFDGEGE